MDANAHGPLEAEYRAEIVRLAERENESLEQITDPASAGINFKDTKERTLWAFSAGAAKWTARALREIDQMRS